MQGRSRDVALIAASVAGLLTAALLPQSFSKLGLQQVSVAAVAVLLARALFLVLLGTIAFRCWEVRQNRVFLGGRKPVPAAQPDRRRRGRVHSTSTDQRGQAAAQPSAAAADSAAAKDAADFTTAEEPIPPAAVLQQSTSTALARLEDVHILSSGMHAGLHHAKESPQQPRVPGPPAAWSTESAAEPPADARPEPHGDGDGAVAAVSTPGGRLAETRDAVSGGSSGQAESLASVHSGDSASRKQEGSQQLSVTATAAAAAADQGLDDSMAPKSLQEARAEMLQRQEAAKAKHAEQQRVERQAQRRRRLDEAEARLEAWRAAQRAAEAAEEASWSQLTAQRRADEARRQLLQEQDAEYQQALQHDAEVAERRRRALDTQQEAADARRLAAERAWSDCAQLAAAAAARLSQCPETESNAVTAATLSLRLPNHPVQRRRFSTGAEVADVYAWAQLELLQGICPTMDAQLQRLRQQASSAAAADDAKAAGSHDGSGSEGAAAAVAALGVSESSEEAPHADATLPADVGEDWVRRWAEGVAGSDGSSWAWHGGWRLVQTYPRRPLPRESADAAGSARTVGGVGLAPQAALAVEQLEDHGST